MHHLDHYPLLPGVYLMKNSKGSIIYIGKAKQLRDRIASYFSMAGDGRIMIPFLMKEVASIETIVAPSESEALLLERSLIRMHKPKYNALLKDDKSDLLIVLSKKSKWPQIQLIRSLDLNLHRSDIAIGPFNDSKAARQIVSLLKKLFRLRSCSDEELLRRSRPCILYDMGRCLAPCVERCTPLQYEQEVVQVQELLHGRSAPLVAKLKEEMEKASALLAFEKAHLLLKTIEQVENLSSRWMTPSQIPYSLDLYLTIPSEKELKIIQLIYRQAIVTSITSFHEMQIASTGESLSRFLLAHYEKNPSLIPEAILLPHAIEEAPLLEKLLSQMKGSYCKCKIASLQSEKQLVEWAEKQARHLASHSSCAIIDLASILNLERCPALIDCLDISHLGGKDSVGAVIRYGDKRFYRKYQISDPGAISDLHAMEEMARRHYAKAQKEDFLPDLIIVDGGPLQLEAVFRVISELDLVGIDLIALCKEKARHDKGLSQEKIYRHGYEKPLILPRNHQALLFLQAIRDEAHRFAISYQKKKRKETLFKSQLDQIKGVGPARKRQLLIHFGSFEKIKKASIEELMAIKGISRVIAQKILDL